MRVSEYITKTIKLDNINLSKSYYYRSLAFCVIDAVYSVGANYTSTLNTVLRFCATRGLEPYREFGSSPDKISNEYTIDVFLKDIYQPTDDELANAIFGNRQRTSTKNGILKSAAVRDFATTLMDHGINGFNDLDKISNRLSFENRVRSIKGQGSGKTLSYFYMLAGDEWKVKPDRHIMNYLHAAAGYPVTSGEATILIQEAVSELSGSYPELTPRKLDHAIWNYQR